MTVSPRRQISRRGILRFDAAVVVVVVVVAVAEVAVVDDALSLSCLHDQFRVKVQEQQEPML